MKKRRRLSHFLTKIKAQPTAVCSLPSLWIRRRLLGLRAVRDENEIFVTRAWQRFCGTVSDRAAQSFSWRKSPSLSHGQPEGLRFGIVLLELVSRPLCWGLPSRLCGSVAEIISSLSKHCDSLGRGLPLSFAGICALSHRYDFLFHRTSKFYMLVPSLCQICPSYGYDYYHIGSDFARLSYRYDNHLMDL